MKCVRAFKKGDKVVYLGKPVHEVNCDEFIGLTGTICNDPENSLEIQIQFEKKYGDDEDDYLLFSSYSVRHATDSEIYNFDMERSFKVWTKTMDNSHIKEKIAYLLSILK